jgi:hypothetical protein
MKYHAVFEPLKLEAMVEIPAKSSEPTTKVAAIYPTGSVLPENLLKFYVHFTAPMSRGSSYQHVQLLDENGVPVELPFVEIGEELWDARQQRLTLLLDPGRIKRGLLPHNEVGPPLIPGRSYTLVIDKNWLDAERQPLQTEFRKTFRVESSDRVQPQSKDWKTTLPCVDSTKPLTLRFGEPLDQALLTHSLQVVDAAGKTVPGNMTVTANESAWHFIPRHAWPSGEFKIRVDTRLEDLAGNSIQRLFDTKGSTAEINVPAQIELPFVIE